MGEMMAEKLVGLNLINGHPQITTNVHISFPADWKRSFSNPKLSSFSLVINCSIRSLISQNISHNFVAYQYGVFLGRYWSMFCKYIYIHVYTYIYIYGFG